MNFIQCQQGTDAWFAARVGKITASCFADAVSRCTRKSGARDVGDPTAVAERYAADLAIERISGHQHGEPPKAWVLERGHEMEAHARRFYEGRTGSFVTEAGICLTDDGAFGYSTDGLVDDDGLIEIKAPIDSSKILAMWQHGDTSEYDHQMQGGMWITGRKWCDFIMYVPDLACIGRDLYVKRVFRDDAFIDAMVARLSEFDQLVATYVAVLRGPQGDEQIDDSDFLEVGAAAGAGQAQNDPQITPEIIPEIIPAPVLPPEQELAAAQANPDGADLSPAAQALNEQQGTERFAKTHPALAAAVTSIDTARVMPPPAPTLRLGQICDRLGFNLTAAFLGSLGFEPAARDKSAMLYRESDFPSMCAALIRHITAVAQAKAA